MLVQYLGPTMTADNGLHTVNHGVEHEQQRTAAWRALYALAMHGAIKALKFSSWSSLTAGEAWFPVLHDTYVCQSTGVGQ